METRKTRIERREVVEFYLRYDCAKKQYPLPDLALWDWSQADSLDRELARADMKHGIVAGYLLWDFVALSLDDLRNCAVGRSAHALLVLKSWQGFVSSNAGKSAASSRFLGLQKPGPG